MHPFFGKSCTINFNSDSSGYVIVESSIAVTKAAAQGGGSDKRPHVEFNDLAMFVDLVRGRQAQAKQDERN